MDRYCYYRQSDLGIKGLVSESIGAVWPVEIWGTYPVIRDCLI